MYTKEPTVRPAVMEGIDPDLTYPIVPPLAVRAPMMKAGISIPFWDYVLSAQAFKAEEFKVML